MSKNRYGLDTSYVKSRLEIIIRDLENYKPDEIERELLGIADTCKVKPAGRKMGDYDLWFKDCDKCGYKIGRMSENSTRKCWKCGNIRLQRDLSDRALKVNST